jgi:hypothetical protein
MSLSELDGRTVVLIRAYEKARRDFGHAGYKCLVQDGDHLEVKPQIWKTFQTVLQWLLSKGFRITWKESAWEGYVRYVFQDLSPTVPQPGQLKNEVLLKRYLAGLSATEEIPAPEPIRSPDEVEALYQRILRPEVRNDHTLQVLLGIKRIG